ncbi:ATP-binding cassette subfamily C protein LapB [Psychrobacter sp. PL15]|uniref:type I secretion system permease/ATPase n=1 Tax=unclassified Psychrobacter TaxID=196806 RepID=UPI001AE13193|nr:type I secretion system permease/ATPase [Psychrobacter sp. PL15]MEC5211303.1 ATP-binding cassette subfamily C protein LapB [Psychrobacter sp. PL15]
MSTPVNASNDQTSDSELIANPTSQLLLSAENEQIDEPAVQLAAALRTLLTEQGYPVDNTRLHGVIHQQQDLRTLAGIINVLSQLGIDQLPEALPTPDAAFLPLLALHHTQGWGVINQQTPQGLWQFSQLKKTSAYPSDAFLQLLRIRLGNEPSKRRQFSFDQLLKKDLKNYRGIVVEAVVASFLINMLALAVSLFSMQVYDRVIPTRSEYTLIILASGVGLVILFETFMKFARSKIMDKVVVNLDQYLSREVFQRLLSVRIDQMPGSVGSMAAQLRGYEQVRSFYTASTLFGLVDIPMAIIFVSLIIVIGNPLVALVPIVAAVIAIILGFSARRKIDSIAAVGAAASYRKTGILVETVEGVETIKAGSGNWKFLSRWLDVMNITTKNDLDMKHANDNLSYLSQMIQQTSYVGIVIVGSFVVMSGDMTMGGLIACSILGGRILAPVMSIPSLLIQHSHAKAAKLNIEQLFSLKQDNHGVSHPLSPSKIAGNFNLDKVTFNYQNNDQPALAINSLNITAGERIAVLGPIGSGKSTLLKVMSGLYAATQGRILLDGLDIQQISRESLSEQVGYLQQDHRLFEGTLRENLLIGLPAPSDDVMREALVKTGLIKLVASHSSGLDLPISEGGKGLSGGQKQLVAFTRLLLTKPSVLLMDEPTASMDNRQELQCIDVLNKEFGQGHTLIVSTHKMPLLQLVDRIIIMDNQKIVMDGPKAQVLEQLKGNEGQKHTNKTSVKVSTPTVKVISNKTSNIALKSDGEGDNVGQDNG